MSELLHHITKKEPGWRVGLNASHSERAPSAEELFANGPHAGTQSFEVGDPDLGVERSWGLEATLHGAGTGYSLGVSVFHSWFDGYIYEVADVAEFAFRNHFADFLFELSIYIDNILQNLHL